MFHIYSPALSVYLVSENEGFKPKVLTQRIRKVKRATPEGAARNIESIWEERYSIVQSSGGNELCHECKAQFAALPQMLMLQCGHAQVAYICTCILFIQSYRLLSNFTTE